MKSIFKTWALPAMLVVGCATEESAISADRAEGLAEGILGGMASDAERADVEGQPIWEVHVLMDNGADVEVKLHAESEQVLEIEDKVGPFDYADFTPVEGVISYEAIVALALAEVPGEVEAWEFKRESIDPADADEYEYEFYVRNGEGELWELKFHAEDGTATDVELKDEVDP